MDFHCNFNGVYLLDEKVLSFGMHIRKFVIIKTLKYLQKDHLKGLLTEGGKQLIICA